MDKTYSLIISIYEGLKLDVVLCADKYGFVHGKEHDMPYHNKMDNFIRKVKSLDNSDGRYDDFLSSDAIYKRIEEETGIKRVKKIQSLTLERLKEQVEEAKRCGFSNGDKWKYDIKNYASYNNMTFEEVMHLLGYSDYKSPKKRTITSCIRELEDYASTKDGYLDGVYGSDAEGALRFLYAHAQENEMDGSLFVMLMSNKLKFHHSRLYVDYMAMLERKYNDYLTTFGGDVSKMKKNDPVLYNMLLHEAEYAPGGRVSVNDIRVAHGFPPVKEVDRRKGVEHPFDGVSRVVKDGVVEKLSDDKELHESLIKESLIYGTTVEGILSSEIVYKNGMSLPRLARVKVDLDGVVEEIKTLLYKEWSRNAIIRNSDDVKKVEAEKERVAKRVYKQALEKVLSSNVRRNRKTV